MGRPVNIYNLACKMINLLGRKIKNQNNKYNNKDIEIIFKGLELGEKLDEVIHTGKLEKTEHPRINISVDNVQNNLNEESVLFLIDILENNSLKLKDYIKNNFADIIDIK